MTTPNDLRRLKTYAVPLQSGLGSDRKMCGRVIKAVLEILQYPQLRFDHPSLPSNFAWSPENTGFSFEHDCMAFRVKLFSDLRKAGWIIKHDLNGDLIVK